MMFSLTSTRTAFRTRTLVGPVALSTRYNSTRHYSSTMHDNDPVILEREKRRNLRRDIEDKFSSPHEHAPGWNEKLASTSEAAVKADRSTGTTAELQSQTVEHMKTSRVTEDGAEETSSTKAFYLRDEVEGPLSGARGTEKVIVTHGRVIEEDVGADFFIRETKREETMTPSEERVKADRDELFK